MRILKLLLALSQVSAQEPNGFNIAYLNGGPGSDNDGEKCYYGDKAVVSYTGNLSTGEIFDSSD